MSQRQSVLVTEHRQVVLGRDASCFDEGVWLVSPLDHKQHRASRSARLDTVVPARQRFHSRRLQSLGRECRAWVSASGRFHRMRRSSARHSRRRRRPSIIVNPWMPHRTAWVPAFPVVTCMGRCAESSDPPDKPAGRSGPSSADSQLAAGARRRPPRLAWSRAGGAPADHRSSSWAYKISRSTTTAGVHLAAACSPHPGQRQRLGRQPPGRRARGLVERAGHGRVNRWRSAMTSSS